MCSSQQPKMFGGAMPIGSGGNFPMRNIAVNHLPPIYETLKQLAEAQGIELRDPPQIKWIDFNSINGNGKQSGE
jgi:hypothetical protein